MEQDEIIRTVTSVRAKDVPIATRMMHRPRKQRERQAGSWVTETKRKRRRDSLEFPNMEAISLSFLLSVNLYVCESKINLSKNCAL